MTPTEQDKELRDRVVTAVAEANLIALQEEHPINTVETLGPVASDMANQLVDQLITADRKRVELRARIEELTLLADFQMGDITVMGRNERSWRDRIAELEKDTPPPVDRSSTKTRPTGTVRPKLDQISSNNRGDGAELLDDLLHAITPDMTRGEIIALISNMRNELATEAGDVTWRKLV